MPDLKCPAWIGFDFDWLCDRPAEYSINGTVLCQFHALSVQNGSIWRKWFDDLQSTHENKREVIAGE